MGFAYQKNSSIPRPREASSRCTAVLEGSRQGGLPRPYLQKAMSPPCSKCLSRRSWPKQSPSEPEGKSPGKGGALGTRLKDSPSPASSPAQILLWLPISLPWPSGWRGASSPATLPLSASVTLLSPDLSPHSPHPWAFARAVMGRLHQVLAACPWASYSLQGVCPHCRVGSVHRLLLRTH